MVFSLQHNSVVLTTGALLNVFMTRHTERLASVVRRRWNGRFSSDRSRGSKTEALGKRHRETQTNNGGAADYASNGTTCW